MIGFIFGCSNKEKEPVTKFDNWSKSFTIVVVHDNGFRDTIVYTRPYMDFWVDYDNFIMHKVDNSFFSDYMELNYIGPNADAVDVDGDVIAVKIASFKIVKCTIDSLK